MVKKYGDLYLDARRALLTKEDPEIAGMWARHLLMHVSGKRQEEILANRELYASEEICREMERLCQYSFYSTEELEKFLFD